MEFCNCVFSELREHEYTLPRGSGEGLEPIPLVLPVRKYSLCGSLKRLENEAQMAKRGGE